MTVTQNQGDRFPTTLHPSSCALPTHLWSTSATVYTKPFYVTSNRMLYLPILSILHSPLATPPSPPSSSSPLPFPISPVIFLFILLFSALVWGSSVKHNPQKVGKDHVRIQKYYTTITNILHVYKHITLHKHIIITMLQCIYYTSHVMINIITYNNIPINISLHHHTQSSSYYYYIILI